MSIFLRRQFFLLSIIAIVSFSKNTLSNSLCGDLDHNKIQDVSDALILVNHILQIEDSGCSQHADINGDGNINVSGIIRLVNYILDVSNSLALDCHEDSSSILIEKWEEASSKNKDNNLENSFDDFSFFRSIMDEFITIDSLEDMATYFLYTSGQSSGSLEIDKIDEFGHYNPFFIDWAQLLVEKALSCTTIINFTKDYYDQNYQELLDEFHKAYIDLERYRDTSSSNEDKLSSLVQRYSLLVSLGQAQRFWLPTEIVQAYQGKKFEKISKMAYLFWIRRHSDSSAESLFQVLEQIIRAFDNGDTSDATDNVFKAQQP